MGKSPDDEQPRAVPVLEECGADGRRAAALTGWFQSSESAMFLVEPSGRVFDCNPAFARLAGEPGQRSIDRWFAPHPLDGPLSVRVRALCESELGDELATPWRGEATLVASGEVSHLGHLVLQRAPVSDEAVVVGLFCECADARGLASQRQVADRLATVGLLAGSSAHEIKNDLAPLVGYLSLLEASDSEGMVALMRESVRRIQDHVEEILAPLRPRVQARGPVVLTTALEEVTTRLRRAGRLRRLELSIAVDDAIVVHADKAELAQLLVNLMTNALDALGDGGGALRGTIDVTATHDAKRCRLEFRDSGCGVDAAMRESVFEAFVSSKGTRGTGLGLPVVRDIVRELGGELTIGDREEGGTIVVVALPLYTGDAGRDH
jgi:signal transduction histidine kinase